MEGSGEEGEGNVFSYATRNTVVLAMGTFLIVSTIFYEAVRETVFASVAQGPLLPIVKALFSELGVLGFLGLITLILDKSDVFEHAGEQMEDGTEAAEMLKEEFELVHISLFFIMIIYIVQLFMILFMVSRYALTEWRAGRLAYNYKTEVLAEIAHLECKDELTWEERQRLKLSRRNRDYIAMKEEFIKPSSPEVRGAPKDFDFARYLDMSLGDSIGDVVRLPLYSWLIIQVILIIVYGVAQAFVEQKRYVWIPWGLSGYILMVVAYALMKRLKWIKTRLIPQATPPVTQLANANWVYNPAQDADLRSAEDRTENKKADFFPPMYLSQPTARGYDPNSWSGVPNKHQQLFGIFGRHGSRAYYQLLRMMLLIMAFYIGSIPRFQEVAYDHEHKKRTVSYFVMCIVYSLPPFVVHIFFLPDIFKHLTIVTSIEMFKRPQLMKHVIDDQTSLKNSNILKLMLALQSKIPLHVLRQAAGVSAGKEVLSPYEEEMFTTFDYDCTGEVPVSLCADLLTAIGRPVGDKDAMEGLLLQLDVDGDGVVTKQEFADWLQLNKFMTSKTNTDYRGLARQLFLMAADTAPPQEIITGDDGTVHSIHRAAFISVLAHLSMKFSKDAINDMWLAIDRDESGTICLDEVSDFLEEHDQYRGS